MYYLIVFVFVFLALSQQAAAQPHFYRGISIGTGHTFSCVDSRAAFNDFNYLNAQYSPTLSFGVDLRFRIREKVSLRTGLLGIARNYRLGYSRNERNSLNGLIDRPGVFYWNGGAMIPLLCIGKVPLDDGFALTFSGGFQLNMLGGLRDEVSASSSFSSNTNFSSSLSVSGDLVFEGQLLAGIGVEKENKNNVICGLEMKLQTGLRKMMSGDFQFSDYSNFPSVRSEYAEYFSRNTALMLNAYFLWPRIKSKDKLPDDKLYFEYRQLQRNFYIGLTTGTGHNFTRVNWRDENNTLNNLKGRYGASVLLGMNFRYDLRENLSIQTGVEYFNRSYRATYANDFTDSAVYYSDIGFYQFRDNDIIIPLLLIGRIPINTRRLYANFTGGAALNFMINPDSYSESSNIFSFEPLPFDSVAGGFYAASNPRKSFQPMLVTGIGIEKKTERRGIVALSLVAYTGFQKVFTGQFYYYDTKVPLQSIFDDFQLPAEQPAEYDKVLSRNTSIFLKFDFFFAMKRWKLPR